MSIIKFFCFLAGDKIGKNYSVAYFFSLSQLFRVYALQNQPASSKCISGISFFLVKTHCSKNKKEVSI